MSVELSDRSELRVIPDSVQLDGFASSQPSSAPSEHSEPPAGTTSLPPVDAGHNAWAFLAAATVIEALVWGLPFSVGVLHSYWTTVKFPGREEGLLTLAATL
jgi:hypothetical protein